MLQLEHKYSKQGSFKIPTLAPPEKSKPKNVARYAKYINITKQVNPNKLILVNEKYLKGADLFNRKGCA
eukprot:5731670-Ditylum_brightwellii.AAC.1